MKKIIAYLLLAIMTVSLFAGCAQNDDGSSNTETSGGTSQENDGSASGEEAYDLTLYSVMTTNANFDQWLSEAEEATGLKIKVASSRSE